MIKPDNKIRIAWDFFIVFIVSILILFYPIQLSFGGYGYIFDDYLQNPKEIHATVTSALAIIFVADIFLNFMTAYYDQGLLIKEKKGIFKNYIKQGFISDLLAYLPIFLDLIIMSEDLEGNVAIVTIKKLTQCLIFLKLREIGRAWEIIEEICHFGNEGIAFFNLSKLTVCIFLFSHVMACLWHATSYYSPFEKNMLKFSGFYDSKWSSRYLRCLFITINPGKIDPQNDLELAFGFFALLATSGSIGFMISSIQNITRAFNRPEETKR